MKKYKENRREVKKRRGKKFSQVSTSNSSHFKVLFHDLPSYQKHERYTIRSIRKNLNDYVCANLRKNETGAKVLAKLIIRGYANYKESFCFMAMETMAKKTGYAYITIRRSLDRLVEIGLLKKIKGGYKEPNTYIVNIDILGQNSAILRKFKTVQFYRQKKNEQPIKTTFNKSNNNITQLKNFAFKDKRTSFLKYQKGKKLPPSPTNFRLSKKNIDLMTTAGQGNYTEYWANEFAICFEGQLFKRTEAWTPANLNYLFCWFFHTEIAKKRQYGLRYIPASKRKGFRDKKLSIVQQNNFEIFVKSEKDRKQQIQWLQENNDMYRRYDRVYNNFTKDDEDEIREALKKAGYDWPAGDALSVTPSQSNSHVGDIVAPHKTTTATNETGMYKKWESLSDEENEELANMLKQNRVNLMV